MKLICPEAAVIILYAWPDMLERLIILGQGRNIKKHGNEKMTARKNGTWQCSELNLKGIQFSFPTILPSVPFSRTIQVFPCLPHSMQM